MNVYNHIYENIFPKKLYKFINLCKIHNNKLGLLTKNIINF
ncbi:hypothetical protein CNEO3_100050 [Clostridium neonatale]|nr:hypothetical protein CNEO3_100050 [Clostridium neonatale]